MGIDLMASRRRIVMAQPHLASATPANPVSFAATLAAPLKELACAFSPVQAGSGDPAPDNVRAISGWTGCNVWRTGANIWDEEWVGGVLEASGTVDMTKPSRKTTSFIPVVAGQTYYQACPTSAGDGRVAYYDKDKTAILVDVLHGLPANATFTIPQNACYMRVTFSAGYGTTYNNDISINYPSTDTSYHPYTGQTIPVQFPATKNLFDDSVFATAGFSKDADGYWYGTVRNWVSAFSTLLPVGGTFTAGRHTISCKYKFADVGEWKGLGIAIKAYYTDGTNGLVTRFDTLKTTEYSDDSRSADGKNIEYLCMSLLDSRANNYTLYIKDIQIEAGSTATPYEPYGTIYGGYIDPVRGVAVATKAYALLNDATKWETSTGTLGFRYNQDFRDRKTYANSFDGLICSYYVVDSVHTNNTARWDGATTYKFGFKAASLTLEQIQQDAAAGKIAICYDLATPIEYPLTPAVLKTLKGANVIYTDLNGNVTPTYWTH